MVQVNVVDTIQGMATATDHFPRPGTGRDRIQVEGRQMVLRIYIDKEGGVTLDDCSAVSRELTEILDVEDFIQG